MATSKLNGSSGAVAGARTPLALLSVPVAGGQAFASTSQFKAPRKNKSFLCCVKLQCTRYCTIASALIGMMFMMPPHAICRRF